MRLCLLCVAICDVVFLTPTSFVGAYSGTDVNNLHTYLYNTSNYNKKVRPLINQSLVLNITMDFHLTSIIEFDEQNENLKTSGYAYFYWVDDYLTWTPSSYNNILYTFVPQDDIWKPDASLRNSYKSFTGLGSSYLNVYITYDGSIEWYPLQVLESTCAVDITYFPYDKQTCELKFTAWSYSKTEVNINVGSSGVVIDEYTPNNQWELHSSSARETTTSEAGVIFSLTLQRKPAFYIINITIPIMLLTILNCFTFVLPVASGERAGYSITVFLSLAVFLTIVASELPKNSDNTSLLAIYLMLMTSLSTTIVMLCLVELRISTRTVQETPINKAFMLLYKVYKFARCQRCKERRVDVFSTDSENKTPMESAHEKKSSDDVTWTDIVDAMDFTFFVTCALFTFLTTVVIFASASSGA